MVGAKRVSIQGNKQVQLPQNSNPMGAKHATGKGPTLLIQPIPQLQQTQPLFIPQQANTKTHTWNDQFGGNNEGTAGSQAAQRHGGIAPVENEAVDLNQDPVSVSAFNPFGQTSATVLQGHGHSH